MWNRRAELLLRRNAHEFVVTKVLGHAKWRDVHLGRISAEDRLGNIMVDKLAVRGAEEHQPTIVLQARADARAQLQWIYKESC